MIKAHYPPAAWKPVSYRAEAGTFTGQPVGWILHVVVGNGSPYGTFEHAVSPHRRFSHLWVAKSGLVEQYAELSSKSWAQAAGNGAYWSVETEGYPTEPLTPAQVEALARWHVWCGAADRLAAAPGQPGIGTHAMGGSAWGGHDCPGAIRSGQRADILKAAAQLRAPVAGPAAPVDKINAVGRGSMYYVKALDTKRVFLAVPGPELNGAWGLFYVNIATDMAPGYPVVAFQTEAEVRALYPAQLVGAAGTLAHS